MLALEEGGNTDLLVDQILEGAETKGHTSEKLYIYNYTIILCSDCRSCKKGDYNCCINDEMYQIYQKMSESDLISGKNCFLSNDNFLLGRTINCRDFSLFEASPTLFGYREGFIFKNCFNSAFAANMNFSRSFFCFMYRTIQYK